MAWNVLEEAIEHPAKLRARKTGPSRLTVSRLGEIETEELPRLRSSIDEWDRVLGGGIVPGSVVLVGGDPGVGKSTLLMQVAESIASSWRSGASAAEPAVLYVSGEESLSQIALRCRRLLPNASNQVGLCAETDLTAILEHAAMYPPRLLIVDSIQSVYNAGLDSAPGTVTQLRDCALQLIRLAKEHQVAVLLVGHVTKDGMIAGPKVLEHMVDAVLYLEGERLQSYRLLRSVKNRFGATNEVGVFEMRDAGMVEVGNPSAAFIADRVDGGSGSAIVVAMEGTRPMLAEVQALVTKSGLAVPRRMSSGIDLNRVVLLTAVLTKRASARLYDQDIHINVAGGLRIEETAADLGLTMAVLSSLHDRALDPETVFVGEIGLSGELRSVGQLESRLREAAALGFRRAVIPRRADNQSVPSLGLEVASVRTVTEAAERAGVQ